ncbi:MAG: glycosyltransferase family 2 protein [Chitinophagaceae bacterium]
MKVSVIIVNYNTFELTAACIRSVIRETRGYDYEIILVDNASAECDPERFREEFPGIILVKNPVNGGFANGNNLGIDRATGDLILLLNSDTWLTEDSISRSAAYFKLHPGTGILGCRMTFPDGRIQYTARRFRSLGWEMLDLFRLIPWLMPYRKRSRLMLGKYFRHDENLDCDWLNGAFFLFSREWLKQLPGGKLDERFFMYGEDQLWCEQAIEKGYTNRFFAGTSIVHINSGSTDPARRLALRKIMMKNELEILRLRKGKGFYYFLFKAVYGGKEMVRNGIKSMYYKLTGKEIR